MSAQHTPGPWTFGYTGASGYCIYGAGQHIAISILYKKDGGEANARLIAAAPELLEALRLCAGFAEAYGQPETRDQVRAAIAKATGSTT